MNEFQKISDQLDRFGEMQAQMPNAYPPLFIHDPTAPRHHAYDQEFISTRLAKRKMYDEANKRALRNEPNFADDEPRKSNLSASGFKWFSDSVLKKQLAYFEPVTGLDNLDQEITFDQFVGALDAIGYCDASNHKHQQIARQLFSAFQPVTIQSMLTVTQTMIAFTLRTSQNDMVQKVLQNNDEIVQVLTKFERSITELSVNQIYRPFTSKKAKQLKQDQEDAQQLECRFTPDVEINQRLVKNSMEKIKDDLLAHGITDINPNNFQQRQKAYQTLKELKIDDMRSKIEKQQEQFTYQPQINKNSKAMPTPSRVKSQLPPKHTPHFATPIVRNEELDPVVYTFQPQISKQYQHVDQPMPRGAQKMTERIQKGYREYMERQNKIATMGQYDPNLQAKLNAKISYKQLQTVQDAMQPRQVYRRPTLVEETVNVKTGHTAKIRFCAGDTVQGLFEKLTALYQLNTENQYKLKLELEKKFSKYEIQNIASSVQQSFKSSQIEPTLNSLGTNTGSMYPSNVQQVEDLNYDPLYDSCAQNALHWSVSEAGSQMLSVTQSSLAQSSLAAQDDDPFFV